MKLAVCVILYNPKKENIEHALKLADFFDNVYLLDNSNKAQDNLSSKHNIRYIPYFKNMGIAKALEDALQLAIQDKNDYLLTLDQDSVYPFNKHLQIKARLSKLNREKDAVYAITTNFDYEQNKNAPEKLVTFAITSGNFLDLGLMKKYDIHFPEELFIDFVDFEFNRRVLEHKLNIIQSYDYYIEHEIGNPLKKNILGIKFTCLNHSPIRYYYRFRNAYYLKHKYPQFYKKRSNKTLFVDKIKMKLFEDSKKEKSQMIKRGISDAKKGILGEYRK